jgi:aminopeptidase N
MASELLQLAVGDWDLLPQGRHRGVPIRDVVAPSLASLVAPAFPLEPEQLDYMIDRVGRYPFDIFGTFVVDAELGFALETQTISLLDRVWFTDYTQDVWDPTMLHELSHMWFGDSVSPRSWSDLWLNEGHASWYEFLYAEGRGQLAGDTEGYPDDTGYATMDELMKAVYAHGDEWRASSGPVAAPLNADRLFSLQRYHGGALVLYALRAKIGTRAFDKLERAYVSRYRGGVASTDDFIALASKVAHRDLRQFLRDWLYGTKTPPMPGHPDWTTNPVTARTTALARAPRVRPSP